MRKPHFLCLIIALAVATSASAQFDLNGPNAILSINGATPSVNSMHDVNVAVPGTVSFGFSSGGNQNEGIILLASSVDPTGTVTAPTPWGGGLNLGNAGPTNIAVLADGVGLGNNPFIDQYFNTGDAASMTASFSVASCMAQGTRTAVQAIMTDATNGPFFFDNTEAGDANFGPGTFISFSGDDVRLRFEMICTPCNFYGNLYTEVYVSTNGWFKFNGDATLSQPGETTLDFVNATGGGGTTAPMVAVLWEDLDVGNVAGQECQIDLTVPGQFTVSWINADYFPTTPIGTISATFICATGDIILDYTGYTAAVPPTEGILGVTAGGAATNVTAHDMIVGGAVNPFSGVGVETVFQNFDGSGSPAVAPEGVDLAGQVINFINNGTGDYTIF